MWCFRQFCRAHLLHKFFSTSSVLSSDGNTSCYDSFPIFVWETTNSGRHTKELERQYCLNLQQPYWRSVDSAMESRKLVALLLRPSMQLSNVPTLGIFQIWHLHHTSQRKTSSDFHCSPNETNLHGLPHYLWSSSTSNVQQKDFWWSQLWTHVENPFQKRVARTPVPSFWPVLNSWDFELLWLQHCIAVPERFPVIV